jgi:hypothetical protein
VVDRLESVPCIVADGRIRPCTPENECLPEEFDWLFTDGWWAQLDDGEEIARYASLFGSLSVAR